MLQDCFHRTDWDVFKEQGAAKCVVLDKYTSTILDYICFCVVNVTGDHSMCSLMHTHG